MSDSIYLPETPQIQSIYHPSDFSEASKVAFAHALKFALTVGAAFTVHHVFDPDETPNWMDFPGVRSLLVQWGLLPEGSERGAVAELGIKVSKLITEHKDPLGSVRHYVEKHPVDLIVLATHQHNGVMRWLEKEVAAPLARESKVMTLFIPHGSKGFVSLADGSINLKNILVPIDKSPSPQYAVDTATRAAARMELSEVRFTTVYVGADGDSPAVETPAPEGWSWDKRSMQGDVVDSIIKTVQETQTDLIVMTTAGRHGFLDALRGSTTERVLRETNCPLLAIPEE